MLLTDWKEIAYKQTVLAHRLEKRWQKHDCNKKNNYVGNVGWALFFLLPSVLAI
jgi:hypothetical protein